MKPDPCEHIFGSFLTPCSCETAFAVCLLCKRYISLKALADYRKSPKINELPMLSEDDVEKIKNKKV